MSFLPYVIMQTDGRERSCDIYSRLLSDRIIFLKEEVSEHSAGLVIAQMLYLEAQDPGKDIQFYINPAAVYRQVLRSMIPCSILPVMYPPFAWDWPPVSVRFCWPEAAGGNGWRFRMLKL